MSTPAPWRPTTRSLLQAAMRLAVQAGRERNRMPSASAATFTKPASVSSLVTITRASREQRETVGMCWAAQHDQGASLGRHRGLS